MKAEPVLSRSYESVVAEIAALHAAKPRKGHPLWIALMGGKLSRPQIQATLRQLGVIPLYNHFFHGPLYVNCPDPVWRRRMAEVVYEEGTGGIYSAGVAHFELYLRLGEAFGISREQMYATRCCGGALAAQHFLENICRRSFLEGFAALALGGEASGPGVLGKVSDAFIKYYGLTPEQVRFYSIHEVADTDHSSGGIEFLREFARTDADVALALAAVRDAIEAMWAMFADVWRLTQTVK
jgi:pyrroloquinoline quinone (PQQ) biosynthesis protein C